MGETLLHVWEGCRWFTCVLTNVKGLLTNTVALHNYAFPVVLCVVNTHTNCLYIHTHTQVFSAQRQSIPNIATILETPEGEQLPDYINFDSLKNKFAAMFDEMRKHSTDQRTISIFLVCVNTCVCMGVCFRHCVLACVFAICNLWRTIFTKAEVSRHAGTSICMYTPPRSQTHSKAPGHGGNRGMCCMVAPTPEDAPVWV